MEDLHEINPLQLGLWPKKNIDKALDEIFKDPLFDDV